MKYEYHYQTRSYETDLHHALRPTQLIQYMQETAEHQIHDQDKDYLELYYEDRKAYIISRMSVEADLPVTRFADLTARTWITEGRAANFPRHYELFHDGRSIARATSTWAMVDVDTKKLIRYADYDTSSYPVDEPPEMRIPSRFRIPKELELLHIRDIRVGYSMTDVNRHMNNAVYANQLYDCIPGVPDHFMTSVNLRYIHEAPFGTVLRVFRSDPVREEKIDPAADFVVYFRTEVGEEINVEAVFGLRKYESSGE
ncbi:MAG: hypothetical protein IJH77_00345 [Mogibacterium sp.]|nr:hypothetical protein [Mogibacterium sp.]